MKKFPVLLIIIIIFIPFYNTSAQWTVSGNFGGGQINSIIINGNEMYAGTSTQGVFRSDDEGLNWVQVSSGLGNSLLVQSMAAKDNYVFAGTSSGGIFYSVNKGANWVQSNQGISQQNIKALITDENNVYAGCIFAGVFRSTNNGLNWSRYALGEGDLLYTLSYNETNFFIGLEGGIYRSTNNGVNWIISHTGMTNLSVQSIVQCGDKTYSGTFGGGVFVTENNGKLWTPVNSGLNDQQIRTLSANGNNLFAGTLSKGINYFNPASDSWVPVNEGLTDSNIISIAVSNKFIFAGAVSGKVWKRPASEIITGINTNAGQSPKDFLLHQNYPNPFNPSTGISFYLPQKVFVSLKIFDNLGRAVSEIYSGVLPEGDHIKYWNAENHSAGIYFYRLQAGLYSGTKKLILLK